MTTDPEYRIADEKQVCKHYKMDPVVFVHDRQWWLLSDQIYYWGHPGKVGISKSISQWTAIIPQV